VPNASNKLHGSGTLGKRLAGVGWYPGGDFAFVACHKLSYYDDMAMTSLNISLPEALKNYVEGQVASGDWGTPSEYVRELIRQDKERRLGNLEQELVAAAKGPKIELPVAEIRRKGLLSALRERARVR